MPKRHLVRSVPAAAAVVVAMVLALPVCGQDAAAPAGGQDTKESNEQLLSDFIHYVYMHDPDLAKSYGQALLDRKLTPEQFVDLVESPQIRRFDEAILRGQNLPGVEATAGALEKLYEQGKLNQARDPHEISRNIDLLTGDLRNRLFARDRLIAAGEYAAPQLLKALLDPNDPVRQAEVRQVFVSLGRQSIMPLVAALPNLDPAAQQQVASLLGDIGYDTSLPYLYELLASTNSGDVRDSCQRAIKEISGVVNTTLPLAERFTTLAESFYYDSPSLTSFPGEKFQLVWKFQPQGAEVGLFSVPVLTPVYHEAMAMRLSERALRHDPAYTNAVSLWIASNFSRQIDTPEGYENPMYGPDRREAMYYAVAAGSGVTQAVLARALGDRDTQLARLAIAAIEKTAGGASLWNGPDGPRPLIGALLYPNRRVQYEAALAIGAAQPRTSFDGSDRVVPILAGAIRDASQRFALVIAADPEAQPGLAQVLRAQGYTVLAPGRSLDEVQAAVADAPGIDLMLVELPPESTVDLISQARSSAKLRSTPILAMLPAQSAGEVEARYNRDDTVRVVREGVEDSQISAAATRLVQQAEGGPITDDQARQYKMRALAVLRDLAVSGNTSLNIGDAMGPLVAALPTSTPDIKFQVAQVLSYIPAGRAQSALMDQALALSGDDRVRMLQITGDSAKRWGNLLEQRQVTRLVQLASSTDDAEATAAAALMGALNLPNDRLVPLIVGENDGSAATRGQERADRR